MDFKYPMLAEVMHKFAINDVVPQKLIVLVRIWEEWTGGGVQKYYKVRADNYEDFRSSFSVDQFTLHEEELLPYAKPARPNVF